MNDTTEPIADPQRTVERCNGCGACCRVLTLAASPEEIQNMAAITRVLGIPSDYTFAADHFRPLSREEALARNPYYASRLPADAHLYTCDRIGDDGRCRAYDERPLVCRGYPWYAERPRPMALADPECGYAADLTDDEGEHD